MGAAAGAAGFAASACAGAAGVDAAAAGSDPAEDAAPVAPDATDPAVCVTAPTAPEAACPPAVDAGACAIAPIGTTSDTTTNTRNSTVDRTHPGPPRRDGDDGGRPFMDKGGWTQIVDGR